jgi:hypothetical protein
MNHLDKAIALAKQADYDFLRYAVLELRYGVSVAVSKPTACDRHFGESHIEGRVPESPVVKGVRGGTRRRGWSGQRGSKAPKYHKILSNLAELSASSALLSANPFRQ